MRWILFMKNRNSFGPRNLALIFSFCALMYLKSAHAKQVFFDCSQKSYCQEEAAKYLESNLRRFFYIYDDKKNSNVTSYTDIDFKKAAKNKIGYLYIYTHGLYMDADYFKALAKVNSFSIGSDTSNFYGSIIITLPGHGEDQKNANQITYMDWKLKLHHILLAARQISDNVILVGHSTGAVLSLVEAMDNPNLVNGLWLIEPAIKVTPWIQSFSCYGKQIISDTAPFANELSELTGQEFSIKKMPLRLGCEVKNIWYEFLNRKNFMPSDFRSITQFDTFYHSSRQALKFLKTPTVLEYNPKDIVIDTKVLNIFNDTKAPLLIEHSKDRFHGDSVSNSDLGRFNKFFLFYLDHTKSLTSHENVTQLFNFFISQIARNYMLLPIRPAKEASEMEKTILSMSFNKQVSALVAGKCKDMLIEAIKSLRLFQVDPNSITDSLAQVKKGEALEEACLIKINKE